jgi:predicted metal-dependent hydrolase
MNLFEGRIIYSNREIHYVIDYVERKTLEIAVYPNSDVIVKAPVGTDYERIQKVIAKRAGWIKRQKDYFNQFSPRTPPRQYISGETHLYMGRQYRLKIEESNTDRVTLSHGFFHVQLSSGANSGKVKQIVKNWYSKKAGTQIKNLFDDCWKFFEGMDIKKPEIKIRKMKTRWGSLSKNNVLTINVDLIKAPKECIKYVIIHELCHLKYRDHGKDFINLMERIIPDWHKVKHKLEVRMA